MRRIPRPPACHWPSLLVAHRRHCSCAPLLFSSYHIPLLGCPARAQSRKPFTPTARLRHRSSPFTIFTRYCRSSTLFLFFSHRIPLSAALLKLKAANPSPPLVDFAIAARRSLLPLAAAAPVLSSSFPSIASPCPARVQHREPLTLPPRVHCRRSSFIVATHRCCSPPLFLPIASLARARQRRHEPLTPAYLSRSLPLAARHRRSVLLLPSSFPPHHIPLLRCSTKADLEFHCGSNAKVNNVKGNCCVWVLDLAWCIYLVVY